MRGVLAALSGIACVLACGGEGASEPMPAELVGVWRTEASRYRESHFEIREGWVIFGADAYSQSMHPIRSLSTSRSGTSIHVEIQYELDDGELAPLSLVHTSGAPPRLKVGPRREPWVPESAARWREERS